MIHVILQQNAYVYNYWSYVWSLPPGPRTPSLSHVPFHTATECICLLALQLRLVATTRSLYTVFLWWSMSYCNRMHMFIGTAASSGRYHQVLVHRLSLVIHVVLQQNAYVHKYCSRVLSLPPGPRTPSLSGDPCRTATECICLQLLELCQVTTTRSSNTVFVSCSISYCNRMHMFTITGASSGRYHQVLVHLLSVNDPCRTATECICLLILELRLVATTRSLYTVFLSWSMSYCNRMHNKYWSCVGSPPPGPCTNVHRLSLVIHVGLIRSLVQLVPITYCFIKTYPFKNIALRYWREVYLELFAIHSEVVVFKKVQIMKKTR